MLTTLMSTKLNLNAGYARAITIEKRQGDNVMLSKIFKAYDIRSTYPDPLNEEAARKVGFAIGTFLKKENDGKTGQILVSRDMRPHSPSLAGALTEGILGSGMNVVDLGMCDTSFMYFAIPRLEAAGGVQTTASHNPLNYNGFKISRQGAKPVGADSGLKDIQAIAEEIDGEVPAPRGTEEQMDLWSEYRQHILKFFAPPNRKLKVYIDASNGMAGELIPKTIEGIKNVEIVRENFSIGGEFAHEPNPLVAENMIPTQQGVKREHADLGACFDGDADRCMIVDNNGEIIGCDHMCAWFAHHFVALNRTDPAAPNPTTIVYDLRSSKVVEETIRELGAEPRMSKVGHVNMKANLRETKGIFGGELSGHFYFRANNFADSGAITLISALTILGQEGHHKTIADLVQPFRKYPQSGEINFEVEDKQGMMDLLEKKFGEKANVMHLDGVSVDAFETDGWWFNVRASNTEPLLRLNAEAKDQEQLDNLLKKLMDDLGEPAEGH